MESVSVTVPRRIAQPLETGLGAVLPLGLALGSAALLILSFPPSNTGFLVWMALVPLLLVLHGRSLRSSFLLSFLMGTVFCIGTGNWVSVAVLGFTKFDLLVTCMILGLYYGLWGLALAHISSRIRVPLVLAAPVLWISMEFVRSQIGIWELPWGLLSHTQYLNLPIIQVSAFTGAYGVSFLIVLVNAFVAEVILFLMQKNDRSAYARSALLRHGAATASLVGITLGYGFFILSQHQAQETISITVIQPNIPADRKSNSSYRLANVARHISLSRQAYQEAPARLIAWPELAVQWHLVQDLRLWGEVSGFAREIESYLVVGTSQRPKSGPTSPGEEKKLNSAFLLSPQGAIIGRYHKLYLFPFGEYLPYKEFIPWPARYASMDDTIPGKEYSLLYIDRTPFASLICWEPMFPDLVRSFVQRGARFLLNISDEAWFGETQGPYQLFVPTVFRAVEHRIAIARSANTGISAFIDPSGRITDRVQDHGRDLFVEGYLTHAVPLLRTHTFYTLYGDIFAYGNILLSLFLLISSFIRSRTSLPSFLQGRRR